MTSAPTPAARPERAGVSVLAVAESDAYVKWAAWTLDRAPDTWATSLVLVDSPTNPSVTQVAAALDGTRRAGARLSILKLFALRREIRRTRPDVVLLACTGPTIAAICLAALPLRRRPLVVSGIPGVGLPVRSRAVTARWWTDIFIAHSRRERREYGATFEAMDAPIRVCLARLPFLPRQDVPPVRRSNGPVVFTAQPSVPPTRPEREQLLRSLSVLGPPAPVVKVRGVRGEMMTHDEPWPYADLWADLVASGQVDGSEIEFVGGALAPVLAEARCLVTVSSTAAIEAMAVGVPVVAIDEFGVDADLLNDLFVGSGVLGPVTSERIDDAGPPTTEWAHDNYLHDLADDDWIATIEDAIERSARLRSNVRFLLVAFRRTTRLLTSRKRRS